MTKIDFVIMWLDDKEPNWQKDFQDNFKKENGDKSVNRIRSWDNLQYWFRGVERYAPWVNNVFLVTCGHVPDWLNLNAINLKVIKHSDFIPEIFLPTFSSPTIEMFVHNISELSEHFVMFNDDYFIINHIKKERFFKNNLPCDVSAFNVYHGFGVSINNMFCIKLLNKNFSQRESLKNHFFKWFSFKNGKYIFRTILLSIWPYFVGFYDHHFPQPFLKSIFKDVWDREGDIISESLKFKFRQPTNIINNLIRYWQLVSGNYYCYDVFRDSVYFGLNNFNLDDAIKTITNQTKSIIILNDTEETDFEKSKVLVNDALNNLFPIKSNFEI